MRNRSSAPGAVAASAAGSRSSYGVVGHVGKSSAHWSVGRSGGLGSAQFGVGVIVIHYAAFGQVVRGVVDVAVRRGSSAEAGRVRERAEEI